MLPINIYTFVHDTVMLKNEEHLKGMFFTHFTPELSDITKRPVNVEFIYDTPSMTDFDYLSYATRYPNLDDYIGLISADINHAVDAYRAAQQRTAKATDIYLILIDGYLSPAQGVEGLALQESNIAFATTLGRTVVAHEIGHCFGATHAATSYYVDPEQFSSHGCATFMATERKEGTCARFRYSDENRGNIRNYVSQLD